MKRYPLFLAPALAAALLVLSGALNQKSAEGHPPALPTSTDPEALALLERAVDTYSAERVQWLEAAIWQQVRCDDFTYLASGRLLTAPGDRLRFDLNVKVGKTQGEMRVVCDGQKLWQAIRVAEDTPTVTSWDLPAQKDGKITAALAAARLQLLQEQGFAGLAPLLRGLRQGMQNAQAQRQIWNGHEVVVVSGTWPDDSGRLAALPEILRPRYHNRLCCVFLDAKTLWPHRLEWWGSEKPDQPNRLLAQTEFRGAVINRPLPEEQCKVEFTVKKT